MTTPDLSDLLQRAEKAHQERAELFAAALKEVKKKRPEARRVSRLAMELHRVGHIQEASALITLEQKLWAPEGYHNALLIARQLIKRAAACYRAEMEAANE